MKAEIKKLPFVPLTVEDLKEVIQELWDKIDPQDLICYTERLSCKLETFLKLEDWL